MDIKSKLISKKAKTIAVKQGYVKAAELLNLKEWQVKDNINTGEWEPETIELINKYS